MKNLYHLCYTSHKEELCRNINDYERMVYRIAQTAITTSSQILAYAVMSTHVHIILLTDSTSDFCRRLRHSYTGSFNLKYGRKGTLGEKTFYSRELRNTPHIAAAISYVLRNPVHHNVTTNPFSYPYSTANLYFRSSIERVLAETEATGISAKYKYNLNDVASPYLRNKEIKDKISFLYNGRVNPLSFIEVGMVESHFGTYNAFQYNLHRRDFQEWAKSQMEAERDHDPVTLKTIEPWIDQKRITAFENKSPHWYKEEQITDLQLCMDIDKEILCLRKNSYTQLSNEERETIRNRIQMRRPENISTEQFRRCIGWI